MLKFANKFHAAKVIAKLDNHVVAGHRVWLRRQDNMLPAAMASKKCRLIVRNLAFKVRRRGI